MIEIIELESYNEQNRIGQLIDVKKRKIKFRLIKPFNQNHNIVVHIRGSADRTEKFKTFAEKMISLNNRTKWNS
jgi:hypothetical protein